MRSLDVQVLGRSVAAGLDAQHGELFSYLFFDPQFTRALLDLGRVDAERWLASKHADGIWELDADAG